ncbi:MAG: response regulator [Bdellovibrionales bacterium]|nr:response regulator [Bdellovibrionales bacterium]
MGYLIVDDQRAARLLLRVFLIRQGVNFIEEAGDSISALRLLMATPQNQSPFRAVFISRQMPEMSGLELLRTIRQLPGWAQFPIVIVSEDSDAKLQRDAMAAGATDYLMRPFTEEDIAALLKRIGMK